VADDAQLIDDSLAGQGAAFGELVLKYQDRLFNTLANVTGCREEAEDVAQEAFVQAFLKLSSFRRDSAFYTWLYRIAFNVAMTRQRRKRPERSLDQGREQSGVEPIDAAESPVERLQREERAARVHLALGAISEEHRAILVLREMEGCCYETIAEILELPVGTVRSRLHRARMQLKDQLEPIHQPDHVV
jgi:RNA polymerase sigma-70 factor (ECF subfamily)